ncbi:MAG: hypothetical protein JWN04_2658 [Myxococcaceae bacterium]|nr:hypothetical protein [Myxococcaceae bacterium]
MATQKDGGLVSRAVREAVGSLVSPQVYSQLVTRSLSAAGLTEIPESGSVLADWIHGALCQEIEAAVGADAAELVSTQLAPIVAHALAALRVRTPPPERAAEKPENKGAAQRSSIKPQRDTFGSEQPTGLAPVPRSRAARSDLVRTARLKLSREQLNALHEGEPADAGHTTRPQAPSSTSPSANEEPTRVLAASAAAPAVAALKSYLEGTAEVLQVGDLVSLLDTLEASSLVEPIVLLDCHWPTIHVTSIAAIGEDLPAGTTIVVWGGSDETWNQVDRERTPLLRWVRCSHEATTDDVGSLCAMLIGATRP